MPTEHVLLTPQGSVASDWDAFQAGAQRLAGSAGAGPEDLRQRFAALVAYQQGADVDAHPVQHIDRLLQVCNSNHLVACSCDMPKTHLAEGISAKSGCIAANLAT